jgi:hypothetical protein
MLEIAGNLKLPWIKNEAVQISTIIPRIEGWTTRPGHGLLEKSYVIN